MTKLYLVYKKCYFLDYANNVNDFRLYDAIFSKMIVSIKFYL